LQAAQFSSLDVLEIGASIGTITAFLLSLNEFKIDSYIAVESNDWCRKQFKLNIKSNKVVLTHSLVEPLAKTINFLIIDDLTTLDEISSVINNMSEGVIIIEGHRFKQRLQILKVIKSRGKKYTYWSIGGFLDSYKGLGVFRLEKSSHLDMVRFISDLIRIRSRTFYMAIRSLRPKLPLRKIFLVGPRKC
jgi:hypothetical protein